MHWLVCTFVVPKPRRQGFLRIGPYIGQLHFLDQIFLYMELWYINLDELKRGVNLTVTLAAATVYH